jgi:ATP-dependent RNA helicase DDX5/DBP2
MDHKTKTHPKIQKNFYTEAESVKNRSQEDVFKYLSENHIATKGENIPRPVTNFAESGLPKYLVD